MTTDPHVIAAQIIGRGYYHGAVLKSVAGRNSHDLAASAGCRNAGERFLRAAREAAKDMDQRELWSHIDYAASRGNASSTKKQIADLMDTITNHRKEQA
ncbi:MAG: hypothetical protein L0K30_00235 [Acidipropionibacterium jensenii]|uniref:hypothetical protein n=1 Tax=Acidipropionibacterium jensenii TaxID=1749 RepID=UPI002649A2F0|nr:hypothetical protein [Acidipropionibacterium jensenii]MDN6440460.1 hypothetical protein [Acidipropionibacterium jensenii]